MAYAGSATLFRMLRNALGTSILHVVNESRLAAENRNRGPHAPRPRSSRSPAVVLTLACAFLSLVACTTPRATAFVRAESLLPLRADTVPVAELSLGGAAKTRVLIDTGSEASLADESFAAAAQFPTHAYFWPRRLRGIGWTRTSRRYALLDVDLGPGAHAHDVALQLIDLHSLPVPGRGGADAPQALLGGNLLEALVSIFDGPAGEWLVVPPNQVNATLSRRYPGRRFVTMRVDWSGGAPVVRLQGPDGAPVAMLLDTGAEISVIGAKWDERYAFEPDTDRLRALMSRGLAAEFRGESPFRRVEGLRLGPRQLHFTAVRTPADRGILGNDVLRTFPFVLDGPRGLLHFPVD